MAGTVERPVLEDANVGFREVRHRPPFKVRTET